MRSCGRCPAWWRCIPTRLPCIPRSRCRRARPRVVLPTASRPSGCSAATSSSFASKYLACVRADATLRGGVASRHGFRAEPEVGAAAHVRELFCRQPRDRLAVQLQLLLCSLHTLSLCEGRVDVQNASHPAVRTLPCVVLFRQPESWCEQGSIDPPRTSASCCAESLATVWLFSCSFFFVRFIVRTRCCERCPAW